MTSPPSRRTVLAGGAAVAAGLAGCGTAPPPTPAAPPAAPTGQPEAVGSAGTSVAAAAESVYHLFVVAVEERDGLRRFLEADGIATGVHYPVPLHLQPAFRSLPYARGDFPHAERLAATMVTLPLYPGLAEAHVDLISGRVRDFLERG